MAVEPDRTPGAPHEGLFVLAPGDGEPATPVLGATTTPWVLDLIRRFRAAGPTMRVCTHLAEDPDQGATWHASVPDLRTCRREGCTAAVLSVLEGRLGRPLRDEPTRCTTCGRVGLPVRGVGVAVGPTMLRGTVCEDCLAARPVPTPPSATAPVEDVPAAVASALEAAGEPLDAAPDEEGPATTGRRASAEVSGRRALRRGWLLAEACCRTTPAGLDADRAVVVGLLARAAKLAKGLAVPGPADAAFAHDLALRSLAETTTTLWWLLRADASSARTGAAAFRAAASSPVGSEAVRDRLRSLGREADGPLLLGAAPDAAPGTWPELVARHLVDRPGGLAPDLGQPAVDPLRLLVAGEHLSLACADYAARPSVDLDPDLVRRLADEVGELRADVEGRSREPDPTAGAPRVVR